MEKICQSCKKIFECKVDDIENCDCNSIQLNSGAIEKIKKEFESCLCFDCLKQYEKLLTS